MRERTLTQRVVELAFFGAALALLVVLLDRLGWSVVGRALSRVGTGGAAYLLLLGLAESVLDAAALRLAVGPSLARVTAAAIHGAGSLANALLPWELGEVMKGALLRRHVDGETMVSGLVVWNYAFKLSRPLVCVAALLVGLLLSDRFGAELRMAVVSATAVGFLPYLAIRLLLRAGPAEALTSVLRRLGVVGERGADLSAAAKRVDLAVRGFAGRKPVEYAFILAAQAGARLASWGALFVATVLLDLGYGFGDVALLYAGLNAAELVLTILPARLGVAEGAAFGLFAAYGLDPGAGLLVYLLLRLRSLAANGLLAPLAITGRPGTSRRTPTP